MKNIKKIWYRVWSSIKARRTYPDKLDVSIGELITAGNKIKIAVIDDADFIYKGALEDRGFSVTVFDDCNKKTGQRKEKINTYSFEKFDIIVCDIHGIGKHIYNDIEGLGLMQSLRKKHPFHIIIAYTGNPGFINTHKAEEKLLDFVFSKDWSEEDFLLNIDKVSKIMSVPKQRWRFLQNRLEFLEASQEAIEKLRIYFCEKIIYYRYLNENLNKSPVEVKQLIKEYEQKSKLTELLIDGVNAAKIIVPVFGFITKD